jgi:hypothetical protein
MLSLPRIGKSGYISRRAGARAHSSKSSMYKPSKVGLRGQPCFKPTAAWKQGEIPAEVRTTNNGHTSLSRSE